MSNNLSALIFDRDLRGVEFEEEGRWVAICLDPYIRVTTARREDLEGDLIDALASHVIAALERGLTPYSGLPKVPEKFVELYDRNQRSSDRSSGSNWRLIPPRLEAESAAYA